MSDLPQRLNIDYRLVWEGDWHAGSGAGSASVDRLVRRLPPTVHDTDRKGQPFLPGSQLKGVLRHHCERLAALFGCAVVAPHQVGSAPPTELLQGFRPLQRSGLVIDRLFGSRYQGDCLFVDDAVPESSTQAWAAREQGRTSMDRLAHTARERTLFVSEVVSGNEQALQGTIRARHPASVLSCYDGGFPLEYALLLAGLRTLDSLGSNRSSGLGRCRIDIRDDVVRWNSRSLTVKDALQCFEEGWELMLELAREEGKA